MSVMVPPASQATKLEAILIQGDLSKLSVEERVSYYNSTCESLKLNPLTKPFEYIQLNGKLTLYAKRDATDQLRKVHNVSVKIVSRENIEGVFVVTAQATLPSGRVDESVGAVTINGLKGDVLANALMKCETKAKRRVTLSICGLGLLDETEVETIPDAKPLPISPPPKPEVKKIELVGEALERGPVSQLGSYVVPIGKKYKDKQLSAISPDALANYVHWLETEAKAQGKPLQGIALEFVNTVYDYFDEQGYEGLNG